MRPLECTVGLLAVRGLLPVPALETLEQSKEPFCALAEGRTAPRWRD